MDPMMLRLILKQVEYANPTITLSRYGKPVMQIGRYRYNRRSVQYKGSKVQWVCSKWASQLVCRASIMTINDEVVLVKNTHNH
ncbi:unnamed protein product [Leptidea sinapis]|uniref:FLYWCH-type domain-containing protein n=1 Tax=Leptidea sinapis TaxID=189913 RepID=A0A5E4Q0R5_9NEOP|nr:unnamed protein product [Leptidea sinapis]